jgi:tRNA pseudouridine38-40 synthase
VAHGVRLTVAYDGTDFHGFQRQPGLRTVQGALESAVERVIHGPTTTRGAGRTDAGVHAEGQIVAFATERELNARRWVQAINRYLPDDVSVRAMEPCEPEYDPRFDARDKTYRYLMLTAPIRDALLAHRVWHLNRHIRYEAPARDTLEGVQPLLDLAAMREACAVLEGTHDFRAFRAAGDTRDNTVRTMLHARLHEHWQGHPNLLAFEIRGNAFMQNMVRILAGTLVAVGSGRRSVESVRALLEPGADRRQAGETAPPQGLTLVHVTLGRRALEAASR